MVLSSSLQALLDRAAACMTEEGEEPSLNFFPFRAELRDKSAACIQYLALRMGALTDGKRTVREVPYSTLQGIPGGIGNLFVVCDLQTPQGVVSVLTDDMRPYVISPGQGIGCSRAQSA